MGEGVAGDSGDVLVSERVGDLFATTGSMRQARRAQYPQMLRDQGLRDPERLL
jgi:hypothetical protein